MCCKEQTCTRRTETSWPKRSFLIPTHCVTRKNIHSQTFSNTICHWKSMMHFHPLFKLPWVLLKSLRSMGCAHGDATFQGVRARGGKQPNTPHTVQLLTCSSRQFGFPSERLIGAMLRQGNKGSPVAGQAKAPRFGAKAGYPQRYRPCCPTSPLLPLPLNTSSWQDKEELKRHWSHVSVLWSSVVTFWCLPLEILLEDSVAFCHCKWFTGLKHEEPILSNSKPWLARLRHSIRGVCDLDMQKD